MIFFYDSCESFLRQSLFSACVQLVTITNPCTDFGLLIRYSISIGFFQDAGLVCAPTEYVRNTDRNAAIDMAGKVGRVVGADIKVSAQISTLHICL